MRAAVMAWPAHKTGEHFRHGHCRTCSARVLLAVPNSQCSSPNKTLPRNGFPQMACRRCSIRTVGAVGRTTGEAARTADAEARTGRGAVFLCGPSSWRKRAHRHEMRSRTANAGVRTQTLPQNCFPQMACRRWPHLAPVCTFSAGCLPRSWRRNALSADAQWPSFDPNSLYRSLQRRCSIRTVGAAGRRTGAAARTADAEARTGRGAVFAARADQAGLSHPILTDGINYQQRFGTPARIVRNCGHAAVPTLLQAPHYEFAGVHLGCGAISICGRIAVGR